MASCRKFELAVLVWPLALVWLASPPRSARADDIIAVTDEHGQKVYINTGDRQPRSTTRTPARLWPQPTSTQVTSDEWRATRKGGSSRVEKDFGVSSPERFPVSNVSSTPASAGTVPIGDLIDQTSTRHQVDPQLVEAIVKVESDGDPRAVSAKGAMGLMQLIPATAQRFGVQDPRDPRQNVEGGVSYLRYLLDLFGGDVSLALAGYNAGENAVRQSGGIPSYRETQAYVRKVSELYGSGSGHPPSAQAGLPSRTTGAPIYRYVDDQGVVHYTNE